MATTDVTEWRRAAEEAARRGADALEAWRPKFAVREKARADLVTDADTASQHAIREFLTRHFPGHGFMGEEDPASHARPAPDAPPLWVVDPLDGTTNYVHDVPMYCVSVGLWAGGKLAVGVVYDPRQKEMFSAGRGQGAWLGPRRLATSPTTDLGEALLSTGFSAEQSTMGRAMAGWEYFAPRSRSLRRTGSTALNLAYIAAGRFDGYWAFDNKAWDVAGGFLLVAEAGGTVTRADGSPADPFVPDSVASNGPLHAALLAGVRDATG